MKSEFKSLKQQEHVLYKALCKYIEHVVKHRSEFVNDFENIVTKNPGFHIICVLPGSTAPLAFSSHLITPASLQQINLDPIDMQVLAGYGMTSIAPALLSSRFKGLIADVIDVSVEIEQMQYGIGHS